MHHRMTAQGEFLAADWAAFPGYLPVYLKHTFNHETVTKEWVYSIFLYLTDQCSK